MKRILFLFITTILMTTVLACNPIEPNESLDTEKIEEEPINYKVEKIILSKGFQSLTPNVEILKKGSQLKLLASPGLLDGSGVDIEKITKSGKEINIYIKSIESQTEKQLSTPQILLEINDPLIKNLDKVHFNVISENYEPISLKLDKNQILNKIYSDFKIDPNSIPSIELNRSGNGFIWDISFSNVFNSESHNPSLVNLDVSLDANTGEIIESIKENISGYIDDGVLLDYIPNKYLLYKRQHIKEKDEYDSLWIYDIETGDKNNIYTSRYEIDSALFSSDNELVSFIESNEDNSDIFIAPISDGLAYKITSSNNLNPKLMKWFDNMLYFVNVDSSASTLFEYHVDENESTRKFHLDKAVESFDIQEDKLLFVEYDKDLVNKNIYMVKDDSKPEKIGRGFDARFLNNSKIFYLENIEKEDRNVLKIYDKDGHTEYADSKYSITNYFKLDDDNIVISKKNTCNNDYILAQYNLPEKNITSIAGINSKKIFYNSEKAIAYINLAPPQDINKDNIIYSIDLNKLNIVDE